MNPSEYVSKALRTESRPNPEMEDRVVVNLRLLHGSMGLETEVGEIQDALKKHIFYGKTLDGINLIEEMGDLFWYCAIICDALGVSFESIMEKNIAKLKARYPHKFDAEKAVNRDLDAERKALETPILPQDEFWPWKTKEEKEAYEGKDKLP